MFTLTTSFLFSCKKDVLNSVNNSTDEKNNITNITKSLVGGYNYVEANRSYKWVEGNTKLDCSSSGTGCVVKSKYTNDNDEIDVSVEQVLALMNAGRVNLNNYFVNNNLKYEFPSLYEDEIFSNIKLEKLILTFEFPYFQITNNLGEVVKIYNYTATLSNGRVISELSVGGYTKKISVNTGEGGPWKCTESGDNCKVSKFRINVDWLSKNSNFTYYPQNGGSISDINADNINKKLLITTSSGNQYGLEL